MSTPGAGRRAAAACDAAVNRGDAECACRAPSGRWPCGFVRSSSRVGPGSGRGPSLRPGEQAVQNRQRKGRGLARARLGQAHDIPAIHDRGYGFTLDGGGFGIAERLDAGGDWMNAG